MLKTAFRFMALTAALAGLGATTVASAAEAATSTSDVPTCSKSITDRCMERPMVAKRHVVHHHHHQRTHKASTAQSKQRKG